MPKKTTKKEKGGADNVNENLKELRSIVEWFDEQSEIDVEQGLEKVKEGARLVKLTKARLSEIENEFKEIQKDIEDEIEMEGEDENEGF